MTSPRIDEFRRWLIRQIPCMPDEAEAKNTLCSNDLSDLLLIYLNWQDRFIPRRPREVYASKEFSEWGDPGAFADELNSIIEKLRRGDDMTPHLSSLVHTHGYFHQPQRRRNGIVWEDKDRVLNALGIHHLHLKPKHPEKRRRSNSNPLLYLGIERESAVFIMLGDHTSYNDGSLRQAVANHQVGAGQKIRGVVGLAREVTAESAERMSWRGVNTSVLSGGEVAMPSMLMGGGYSVTHVRYADEITELIEQCEPVLEGENGPRDLLGENNLRFVSSDNLLWRMNGCDFGLLADSTGTFFQLKYWLR